MNESIMNLQPARTLFIMTAMCLLAVTAASAAEDDLQQKMSDPQDWAAQAGDYANQRWSNLQQINANNVAKLQVAWTMSTGVLRGHEGSPLVIGDTMYMHTPFRTTFSRSISKTRPSNGNMSPSRTPTLCLSCAATP